MSLYQISELSLIAADKAAEVAASIITNCISVRAA